MNNIFVSIIIPTFNREALIRRAIDSVFNQEYKNWELIIVDDGSTDGTKGIVERYLPNLKYLNIQNSGVSTARNYGIKQAKGEWIAFLDSDDEWLPNRLFDQIKLLTENPRIRLIHGEEIWIRNGKRVNPKKRHQKSGGDIFIRSLELCLISPSAALVEKKLIEEMGCFDENFIVCEDYDLWLKITANNEVGFISEPIIKKYGGHEDQLSKKFFAMDWFRVKSMYNILQNVSLSRDKKIAIKNEITKKGTVLLQGYAKRENQEKISELEKILMEIER